MTTQPSNHGYDADELVSELLDGEPGARPLRDAMEALDGQQLRRAADLQLVHSLLVQMGRDNEVARERRVRRALDSIAGPQLRRFIQPALRYGIAAMLAIAAVVFFVRMPATTSAMAAVDQMIAAIDRAGDRTYSITVEGPQPPAGREPGERAGLDGATLYLRSSDRFVLVRKTPSGKDLINGSDGQTRWLVRPNKPVLVSSDPQAFRIPMPPELAEILSLDLKSTLVHIRDHYTVKYLAGAPASQPTGRPLKYLDAVKTSRHFREPQNIEIWADAETGMLVRMEFAGIHLQGDPTPRRLIIDLKDQTQLPDAWFTHQAHHAEDAEVDFLTAE
jgi:outer membrane lipoprotein-sorting protein